MSEEGQGTGNGEQKPGKAKRPGRLARLRAWQRALKERLAAKEQAQAQGRAAQATGGPVRVLKVGEGPRVPPPAGSMPCRSFSVVLSALAADESIVRTAADPKTGLKIPQAGEPHPDYPFLVSRPPWLHPVGIRRKDGPLLAARTNFWNLRVAYEEPSLPAQGGAPPEAPPQSPSEAPPESPPEGGR